MDTMDTVLSLVGLLVGFIIIIYGCYHYEADKELKSAILFCGAVGNSVIAVAFILIVIA